MDASALDYLSEENISNNRWASLHVLKYAGFNSGTVIKFNDCGYSFDEIADYIDRNSGLMVWLVGW